jgi:hypothetical protein
MKKLFLLACILLCIFATSCSEKPKEHTYNLLSLDLQNSLEGQFFLGSGMINNDSYFFFYTEDEHGLCQLNKVYYRYLSFYQDGGKTATYTIEYVWVLHIPKNSIKENFKLN